MGGLPCYQKIIHDGSVQKAANNVIRETQITTELLAAKGYYDSPMLQDFINLDIEITNMLKQYENKIKAMNINFANETT